jgi:transmembrane sensor
VKGTSAEMPRSARRHARAEAAAWIVRLHGPHRTPELETAFRQWLAENKENAREFERVTEVWDSARGIPAAGMARLGNWSAASVRPREGVAPLWGLAKVAVALVVCVLPVWLAYLHWSADVYRTGVGEERLVRLHDGSRISLNSNTRIEVKFSNTQRHVTLTNGEAYFEAAHDAARPFVVSAGGHDVTALGTSFLIRYEADKTAVTLVDGKVTVSNATPPPVTTPTDTNIPSAPAARPTARVAEGLVTLTPGERIVLARNTPPAVDSPHIDVVTAWRRGEVILDKTELHEAVAEMNRYEDTKLVLDSPEAGHLKISGIYHTGDGAGFARTIAKLYQLRITQKNNEIHFSASRPGTGGDPDTSTP